MPKGFDFAYQPYSRPFKVPLKTHHGDWAIRQGIFVILRDRDSGAIGVGEIAPLPWFGTETLEEAIAFCQSLSRMIDRRQILEIPNTFPCSQFAFGCALEALDGGAQPVQEPSPKYICALLPAGRGAIAAWESLWQQGHRTFKWKIGVNRQEFGILPQIMASLPGSARLRLDANGGLTEAEAKLWLAACDRYRAVSTAPQIDYVEQPLPPEAWRLLLDLAQSFQTAVALDESIATPLDLQQWQSRGWPGVYCLKPAIMGFPWVLRANCQRLNNPMIFSSVFEAKVGRAASLGLAKELGTSSLALGFGVDHWLAESPNVSISSSIFP